MTTFEIISGILMIITSVAIIILCLLQGKKDKSMTSAIGGSSNNDSFYGKNSGRTIEAKLSRLTKIFAILFFVATLAMNIVPTFLNK